jgi:UDP-glucose 4-epimerase
VTVAWVVGGGGLVGTALRRALQRTGVVPWVPSSHVPWFDPDEARAVLLRELGAFSSQVAGQRAARWEIYWAAGVGTMHSREADLQAESSLLHLVCQAVVADKTLRTVNGGVALASSAGAIYGAAQAECIDEGTPPAPGNAYGRAKLGQEQVVAESLQGLHRTQVLLARMSTIYGVGQSESKAQGLLSHIARCVVRNEPFHVYVPLDTIRDYIAAEDAALETVLQLRRLSSGEPAAVRVVASERPTTIAEIVGHFKRLAWRPPRLIACTTSAAAAYTRRIQFRSRYPHAVAASAQTPLPVGIARLLAHAQAQLAAGGAAQSTDARAA